MSKDEKTCVDPKTGQEMESTWLARWGPQISGGLISGLVGGLLFWLVLGVVGEVVDATSGLYYGDERRFWMRVDGVLLVLASAVACAVVGAVSCGLFYALVPPSMGVVRDDRFIRWAHDRIARFQHRRRQRLLRSQEHVNVSDGALSRARPSDAPQPTDAALSVAGSADEPARLSVSIEEDTQVVVDDRP